MLRSVLTLNRTVCNRACDETRHNPKAHTDAIDVGRWRSRFTQPPKNRTERLRRSLV